MAGLIYEFLDELKQEIEIYDKLFIIANEKRTYIIKGDIERISKTNAAEEHIVTELKGLERRRKQLMSDIAMILNIDSKAITISQIEEALKNQPDEANELGEIKKKLTKSIENLKNINSENMTLINQSLEYAEFSLNVLQSSMGDAPETANYGKAENQRSKSFFDTKQ